eukprot:jgi/Mesvir1/26261/Mv01624-RA.1
MRVRTNQHISFDVPPTTTILAGHDSAKALFLTLGVRMPPGLVREYPRLVLYGQHHVSPFFPCGCFPSVPHVLYVGAGHFCMTNSEVFVHAEDGPGPVLFARHTTAEGAVFEMKGVKRIVYRSTQDPRVPPLSVNAPPSSVITRAAIGNLIELWVKSSITVTDWPIVLAHRLFY